jgi:diketogulonate reductase-like aldo/keto reductase
MQVPPILYGTAWKEESTERCVTAAIDAGFRGIDTANQRKHYFEEAVGAAVQAAIRAGKVTREELFLQTKFTHRDGQDHRLPYDERAPIGVQVQQSFESSLAHFGTDRLDSLVLHGPSRRDVLAPEDIEVWHAMERIAKAGKVALLGASNVTAHQVLELVKLATVKVSFVQNRCYAERGWDRSVRTVCTDHGITYQGFSLLTANRYIVASNRVGAIAKNHGVTPAQVIFRFAQLVGMLPLTGTRDPQHMREDLAAERIPLTADEVSAIETAG